MIIRPHHRTDADRIAEILSGGWQQAYSAFMPSAYLARQTDAARRRAEIAEWLDTAFDAAGEAIFVADVDDKVDGFIHMELGDKGDLGATGIVNLIYVDPTAQSAGIGRRLMAAGAAWLLATCPGPLVLSAFAENPFRGFYGALGGVERGRRQHEIEGRTIESVLYLWRDPAVLLQPVHPPQRPR